METGTGDAAGHRGTVLKLGFRPEVELMETITWNLRLVVGENSLASARKSN